MTCFAMNNSLTMKFIADFHIHSLYSIATSKNLTPEYLEYWAQIKGIKVIGTGDFTHPGWLSELKEKLEPAEQGLFRLKDRYRNRINENGCSLPGRNIETRFLLTSEISTIYKKNDRTRKVHNIIFSPDFKTAERIQKSLSRIGNIHSDGRPILGLDSRDLLEISLDASEDILFVPAHIWTPWFSVLGDKSGFDSIEACYEDLSKYIFAVETGLSSDPPMNRLCSFLDNYTLLSNSDAHSPEKLGRNANLFNTDVSYKAIIEAVKSGNPDNFLGTIDLFPQEGKYHFDGHKKCGIRWSPEETRRHNGICSVCNKPVTTGVMNRVMQLADRKEIESDKNHLPFLSIIPLKEILSELAGTGVKSKKVTGMYNSVIQKFGTELDILLFIPEIKIEKDGWPILAEGIKRMRARKLSIVEGFDGEYGQIRVFEKKEIDAFNKKNIFC